jgi:hypothetical protein
MEANTQPTQEKVYKTPAYIRKAVNAYTARQKSNNKEEFTQRKRGYDKKYYEKIKKKDSSQEENKN